MTTSIYGFLFGMWVLILVGGGILVNLLGPISIDGFGNEMNSLVSSGIKAVIAVLLVITWIVVLSKMKNWIFKKEIKS